MSVSIICQACGERVNIPEDHVRNKIRCPLCGVYCPIPKGQQGATEAPQTRNDPTTAVEEEALAIWLDDEAPAGNKTAITDKKLPQKKNSSQRPPKPPKESFDVLEEVDEEQEVTYGMVEDPKRPCPGCRKRIDRTLDVCPHCQYDFVLGKKPQKKVPPLSRRWEPWLPRETRWKLFLFSSIPGITLGLTAAVSSGEWLACLGAALGLVLMLAFLLGSFLRVDFSQSNKGKIRLTRTWFLCFVQRPTERLSLGEYEGVSTRQVTETGLLEWCIFLFFVPTVLLAALWWWFVMRQVWCEVALTQGHGYPACILYFGGSEEMMHEMASTLQSEINLA